jgi:hypothetical protein
MNPEIDFRCENGQIIQLEHLTYPWTGNNANTSVQFGEHIITRKDFHTYIHDQILPALPYLFNGYAYSVRQLVLPWIWEKFSRGNRVMAGHCFKHMSLQVHNGDVPFTPRHMPCDSSGTRHYYYTGPDCTIWDFGPPNPFV